MSADSSQWSQYDIAYDLLHSLFSFLHWPQGLTICITVRSLYLCHIGNSNLEDIVLSNVTGPILVLVKRTLKKVDERSLSSKIHITDDVWWGRFAAQIGKNYYEIFVPHWRTAHHKTYTHSLHFCGWYLSGTPMPFWVESLVPEQSHKYPTHAHRQNGQRFTYDILNAFWWMDFFVFRSNFTSVCS